MEVVVAFPSRRLVVVVASRFTFFSLRTSHVIIRVVQGPHGSRRVCSVKSHFIRDHVSLECSLDPVPSCLHSVYYDTDATNWNQTNPVRDLALVWIVWPSGRFDFKHKLRAQVLH